MYETFDHTADIGLRVRAGDLGSLFAEAGRGLASLLIENADQVRPQTQHAIELEGTDTADLLVDWLRELLFLFQAEGWIFIQFDVEVTENGLRAQARGDKFDPERHQPDFDIKAVTYHHLRLEQDPQGWIAEVIFDI